MHIRNWQRIRGPHDLLGYSSAIHNATDSVWRLTAFGNGRLTWTTPRATTDFYHREACGYCDQVLPRVVHPSQNPAHLCHYANQRVTLSHIPSAFQALTIRNHLAGPGASGRLPRGAAADRDGVRGDDGARTRRPRPQARAQPGHFPGPTAAAQGAGDLCHLLICRSIQ